MQRKASYDGIAAVLAGFTDEEKTVFVNNGKKFKELAANLVREAAQNTFFTAISDKDAPAHLADAVAKWRKMASDMGYTGPVLWAVKGGFTLETHALLVGPGFEQLGYIDDKPTTVCKVFFVPRVVATKKDAVEQMWALEKLREEYGLPALPLNHSPFGSATLIAGLILAHFKRTGERTPLNRDWVRTGTLHTDGRRIGLGGFAARGLDCGVGQDDRALSCLGVFPLALAPIR